MPFILNVNELFFEMRGHITKKAPELEAFASDVCCCLFECTDARDIHTCDKQVDVVGALVGYNGF